MHPGGLLRQCYVLSALRNLPCQMCHPVFDITACSRNKTKICFSICSREMWYHGPLRSIPLHKATQKGDTVEVAALLAQVTTITSLTQVILHTYCYCSHDTQHLTKQKLVQMLPISNDDYLILHGCWHFALAKLEKLHVLHRGLTSLLRMQKAALLYTMLSCEAT